ncbi:MAG: GIY-YIG nuclease family protein [Crocinitomicaceae bacterium]|nr:GIY-YIG nuclease family protein [Crocinitomicaceae bacterium]
MANLYYVYILECSDKTFYVGMTSDMNKRLTEHQMAKDPTSYTARRLPIHLVFKAEFTDPLLAMNMEQKIKKWSKAKKLALINDEFEKLPGLSKKKF